MRFITAILLAGLFMLTTNAPAASIVKVTYQLEGDTIALMVYSGPVGGPNSDPAKFWALLSEAPQAAYDVNVKPDQPNGKAATLKGNITVSLQIRNQFSMGKVKTDTLLLQRDDNTGQWYPTVAELNRLQKLLRTQPKDARDGVGNRTVKVFVLAGQSNMVGHGKVEFGRNPDYIKDQPGSKREIPGGIGGLRHMATNAKTSKKFGRLLDEKSDWIERDDVFIYSTAPGKDKGRLSVGFGKGNWFGPELGFGMVVGDYFKEPVLIIKTAWGGKDLAVDFRPPSSGDTALKKDREVGAFYRQMIAIVNDRLESFEADFPKLKGLKPEFVGFGWHQGWNDGCSKEMTAEYEQNMANFIKDVRKDLGVNNLPFVIANTGQNGLQTVGTFASLCQKQLDIGNPQKHPEFKGTVTSIDTRPFKAPKERSPSHFGYHWNHSGETHYRIGEAMGQAMVELLNK